MKDKSKSINVLNIISAFAFISALLVAIGMSFSYLGYYTPPVSMSYVWWSLIFTVLIVTSGVLASLQEGLSGRTVSAELEGSNVKYFKAEADFKYTVGNVQDVITVGSESNVSQAIDDWKINLALQAAVEIAQALNTRIEAVSLSFVSMELDKKEGELSLS